MFFESLKKRNNELKVCRGSMPCYSALSVMISARFALAGGNLPKATKRKAIFLALKPIILAGLAKASGEYFTVLDQVKTENLGRHSRVKQSFRRVYQFWLDSCCLLIYNMKHSITTFVRTQFLPGAPNVNFRKISVRKTI